MSRWKVQRSGGSMGVLTRELYSIGNSDGNLYPNGIPPKISSASSLLLAMQVFHDFLNFFKKIVQRNIPLESVPMDCSTEYSVERCVLASAERLFSSFRISELQRERDTERGGERERICPWVTPPLCTPSPPINHHSHPHFAAGHT